MTFEALKAKTTHYEPALRLDEVLPRKRRAAIQLISWFCTALFAVAIIVRPYVQLPFFTEHGGVLFGLFFIFSAAAFTTVLITLFYNSHYFIDVEAVLREKRIGGASVPLSYLVAQIIYGTDEADITLGFVRSPFGSFMLSRLGITPVDIQTFFTTRAARVSGNALEFSNGVKITAPMYAQALFVADTAFAQFLFERGIQEREYMGAAKWVDDMEERAKHMERWWGKDGFGRIPSIGKSWSYGQIYHLERYASEIVYGAAPTDSAALREVESLEAILVRSAGANALIVAEAGSGEMDVIYGLVGMIRAGTALPLLEGKRVFVLRTDTLVDQFKERTQFEKNVTDLLVEAVRAGDIIVVLDDLPTLIQRAGSLGVDIGTLLSPFLQARGVQLIAIADKTRFHEVIELNTMLTNAFEVLRTSGKDELALVTVLEDEVLRVEHASGVFFTYQAVEALAQSAARFFTEGVALDKARDLLLEVPTFVRTAGRTLITRDDVLALVESKTGVPQARAVEGAEKEKLLNLESILHSKVVGQDEAIAAIANAMRRSRAGLTNENRPIGSFLFLGPTGVGKTETAKALAEVFFGSKAPMLRLDMSEYSGGDALNRLIGSFEGKKAGVLATMLRDQKYGVLLLDEFEKTTPEVLNLFLQILDEGFFSDMLGKRVNARNVIVIATSNAGSNEIFKLVGEGKNLTESKGALIDTIVSAGIFKPELINRFDGVILFHPLGKEQLVHIARLMAERLGKQLSEQGLRLRVTDDLLQFLVREGFDEKFGARPMNRVLQERVEKLLADELIRGAITKGSTVEFVASEAAPGGLEVRAAQ
jgi:ATP-dependent Clp protease ATP-binding subunit ClpC